MGLIVASAMLVPEAEIVADDCSHDCEQECSSNCDCLHCLPTLHLVPAIVTGSCEAEYTRSWVIATSHKAEDAVTPPGIEHPPRR